MAEPKKEDRESLVTVSKLEVALSRMEMRMNDRIISTHNEVKSVETSIIKWLAGLLMAAVIAVISIQMFAYRDITSQLREMDRQLQTHDERFKIFKGPTSQEK